MVTNDTTQKYVTTNCPNCESAYSVDFNEDEVTEDEPLFCPFCGDSTENFDVDDDLDENEE